SWRVFGKCAHRLRSTLTPRRSSSLSSTVFNIAAQPPQPVDALVQPLRSASVTAPSLMASQISPLLTLWQEQIVAVSGNASLGAAAAPSLAGRVSDAGSGASPIPLSTYCSKVAENCLAPTRMG